MPAEEQHEGPSLCAICGDEVDETVDYTTALTCSFWGCGRHNVKGLYHTECVGDYQRQNSITKGANTGYLCPRGNSRADIDKENPCRGKIQATHHRLPNKKKKQPPQPLPAAMFPSRQAQASKPKAPKPQTPGPQPKASKPVSKEAIQRQVLQFRQATQATQGDSVLERLRGGPQPQQPSVIPGMEFEVKKKKPAKKKAKASKQHQSEEAQDGAAANGSTMPKPVSLTQLPNIMPKMGGDKNYITDLNRYNLLIGGQCSSDEETDDRVSDDDGSGSQPNYSPSASDFGSHATAETHDPWGGALGGLTTPSPEPPPHTGPPLAAHGVVDWGLAPGGADAVFDFGSLNIDFGAGVPEEIITYMASLPDELSELYLSELGNHMSMLQKANDAAVAEHQQQLQAELLEQERREMEQQQALQQLAAEQAQQQQQQQLAAEQARLHAQQLLQQQQQLAHEQADQKAREQQQQEQLLAQQQAQYCMQLQQQQQLEQQQQKQAAYAPVQSAPATAATPDVPDEVDDLLALCLGED